MGDIKQIELIIEDGAEGRSWGEDCATYLKAIAMTQVLILKEMRKTDEVE